MSNQVQFQSFNFQSSAVRVITDPNQEYWFCGVDVCNILGYENSRTTIQKHCKQGGVSKRYTPTQSGEQEMIFINEPNLYRLIIKSRKPEAEPFEAWVFEEVLPQIRKTGQYSQNNQQNLPLVEEKKYTLELTEYELRKLCWLWKMAEIMRSLLYILYEPLNALGSRYSGAAYGYSREYQFSIEESRKILLRATADIQPHKFDADWNRVLPELRKGKVNNY